MPIPFNEAPFWWEVTLLDAAVHRYPALQAVGLTAKSPG